MEILKNLHEECIVVHSSVPDKRSLLREIAQAVKKLPDLENYKEEDIYKALSEREKTISTGVGDGLAIPHCTLDGLNDCIVGIITVPKGIDFDSIDGKKVDLCIFIIDPKGTGNQHIQLLATISQLTKSKETKNSLVKAKTKKEIREIISEYFVPKDDFIIDHKEEYSLFHIVVQREEVLCDLIEVFQLDEINVSVLQADDPSFYLHKLPLFASFWNEEKRGYIRIIMGIVPKKLTNEMLRRINTVINNISQEPGITVVVNDVSYLKVV